MTVREQASLGRVYQRVLRRRSSRAENAVASVLMDLQLRYQWQKCCYSGLPSWFVIADFYLPKPHKLIIEVDGPEHRTARRRRDDFLKDVYYRARGFKVLRIPNELALTNDDAIKAAILKALQESRPLHQKDIRAVLVAASDEWGRCNRVLRAPDGHAVLIGPNRPAGRTYMRPSGPTEPLLTSLSAAPHWHGASGK